MPGYAHEPKGRIVTQARQPPRWEGRRKRIDSIAVPLSVSRHPALLRNHQEP